jgi:hypothetical protein
VFGFDQKLQRTAGFDRRVKEFFQGQYTGTGVSRRTGERHGSGRFGLGRFGLGRFGLGRPGMPGAEVELVEFGQHVAADPTRTVADAVKPAVVDAHEMPIAG